MINLLRNREVRIYFVAQALIAAACAILCALLGGTAAGLVATMAAIALLAGSILFTRGRYRDIRRLSDSLSKIAAGDYGLDLREYAEGELSVLYDELHKVTRTLSLQAERLQRDKQWLVDTMADISHQLKTPLTSLSLMTDLLGAAELPPEKKETFLRNLRAGVERIRRLVVSLLKLSQLDADAVILRQNPVDVEQLVEQAAAPLRISMELKGQTLSLELEDAAITGDLPWLTEALGNLLKNCVEHTPAGGRIGVRCTDNPLYTLMEVWDNGDGIPQEDIPHIFERFYRGKNATADSVGIGLALSKSIINRHGGSIEVRRAAEQGACFRIKFYKTAV